MSAAWAAAERRYRPGPFPGNVALFEARVAASGIESTNDDNNGWSSLVRGRIEVIGIDADHIGIVDELNAPKTAAELNVCSRKRGHAYPPASTSPPASPARASRLVTLHLRR